MLSSTPAPIRCLTAIHCHPAFALSPEASPVQTVPGWTGPYATMSITEAGVPRGEGQKMDRFPAAIC